MLCSPVYEEQLLERTLDVCQGGVDVIIDFVSSPRTVKRDLKVLREVRVMLGHIRIRNKINIGTTKLGEISKKLESRSKWLSNEKGRRMCG